MSVLFAMKISYGLGVITLLDNGILSIDDFDRFIDENNATNVYQRFNSYH